MVNPIRNIVKPNKGLWNAKRKVWYHHNSDDELGADEIVKSVELDKFDKSELALGKLARGGYREPNLDRDMNELRTNPSAWRAKERKAVRETNKLAREMGYARGWKQFAEEKR